MAYLIIQALSMVVIVVVFALYALMGIGLILRESGNRIEDEEYRKNGIIVLVHAIIFGKFLSNLMI